MTSKKKIQTSKIFAYAIMIGIALNCLLIELYAMFVMVYFHDLSALYTLITTAIGSCIAELLAFAIYSLKAFNETKEEERNKITCAMQNIDIDN